ncbi:MAG: stress response protein [Planctomycetota bacterium]|nr:MAG: stress response protein [Planctomycetota bacterium]
MFSRILLTTDFSTQAEHAYPWAAQLATSNGGMIHLMHALEDDLVATAPVFANYMAPGALDLGNYREEFRAGARKALEAAAEKLRALGATVEVHLVEKGKPSTAVVKSAQEFDCTIIVISTHGRGGLAHLLLGSTAEKVVRMATVPVLTVHDGDIPPPSDGAVS